MLEMTANHKENTQNVSGVTRLRQHYIASVCIHHSREGLNNVNRNFSSNSALWTILSQTMQAYDEWLKVFDGNKFNLRANVGTINEGEQNFT